MLILVSGATKTFRRYQGHPYFGRLITPRGGHRLTPILDAAMSWACDNDAYSAWCPDRFRRMLARIAWEPRCLWVACPDVVADARSTLDRFDEWTPEIERVGQPIALVGQDGAECLDLPWDRFACLFVGGTTAWKESTAAMGLCDEAKRRGKLIHVGRVNSMRRLRKVWDWGTVDSVDGTCFSRWPNTFFPAAIRWVAELESQSRLAFPR